MHLRQRYRTLGVGLWHKVFPPSVDKGVAVGVLAVVHYADVPALRPDRRKHILVGILFGDEWLCTTLQRNGGARATAYVDGVDGGRPQALKRYRVIMCCHSLCVFFFLFLF